MSDTDSPNPVPPLALAATSLTEYAHFVRQARYNELWWYYNRLVPYRHSSRPFQDDQGRWWFCVKPKFAWPVDFFEPVEQPGRLPLGKAAFGRQYPVPPGRGNSLVRMNVIEDCTTYGLESVASNKRRAVRKGLRSLAIRAVGAANAQVQSAALEVWNSHVERTGWNRTYRPDEFSQSWTELAAMPGTTVLAAYEPGDAPEATPPGSTNGLMCGWLIARVFAATVWIDTIASHSDRQANRPNDALIFTALSAAAAMPGVRHAHYSLVSSIQSLEKFKQSLGFSVKAFESRLEVVAPVRWGLKLLRPAIWQRLLGQDANSGSFE